MSFDYQSVLNEVIDFSSSNPELQHLCQSFDNLLQVCHQVFPIASIHDYGDTQANGYWTYIKLVTKFISIVKLNLQQIKSDNNNDYLDFCTLLVDIGHLIVDMHHSVQTMDNNNDQVTLCYPSTSDQCNDIVSVHFLEFNQFYFGNSKAKSSIESNEGIHKSGLIKVMGPLCSFWLTTSVARLIKLMHTFTGFFGPFTLSSFYALWNANTCGAKLVENYQKGVFQSKLYYLATVQLKWLTHWMHFENTIQSSTLEISYQCPYQVVGDKVLPNIENESCKPVRCRLIRKTRNPNVKTLILHCHAGGFMIGSPDFDEVTHLRSWCSQLGVSILSIDYTLNQKFPKSLNDVLAMYIWLRSSTEDQITEKLGFCPKHVILVGESAGGNLVTSLTFAINEIRKNVGPNSSLQLPDGIVTLYGGFNMAPAVSPSRFLLFLDTMLHNTCYLNMQNVISGGATDYNPVVKQDQGCSSNSKPWFLRSQNEVRSVVTRMGKTMSSGLATPLFYQNINDLSSVPLAVITTHYCPLLDDSISMAKLWKGPLTLDVVDDLPHAFVYFSIFSKGANEASKLCAKRIQELISNAENIK